MKNLKYLILVTLLFPLLFISSCDDNAKDENARQRCQLACDNLLIAGLDACDRNNPPNQPGITPDEHQRTLNACYREKINAFRICIEKCNNL